MHPTSLLLLYLLAALVIPGLPFFLLPILLLTALAILRLRRQLSFRLLLRTRWLLLVLMLGYAYSVPGEPMWQSLGGLSPTWEGGRHGVEQAARLIVLLLWLDVLVLRLPIESLLAGLYQLLRPFALLGMDPRRAALRLGLTLRAIEGMQRGRGNLKGLLDLDYQAGLPDKLELNLYPMRWRDKVVPGLLALGLLAQWLHWS